MSVTKAETVSLAEQFAGLTMLVDRTPETTATGWSAAAAAYRDGGVFVAYYAGNSEWERHPQGDEVVFLVEGETTIFLESDGGEVPYVLSAGELIVVPRNTWHRFESPEPVKVMTVTPQPTDHSVARPF